MFAKLPRPTFELTNLESSSEFRLIQHSHNEFQVIWIGFTQLPQTLQQVFSFRKIRHDPIRFR